MGMWWLFECEFCGYRTEVSGGDDVGMLVSTTTISCETCEELYDVVTEKRSRELEGPAGPQEPRCPNSGSHRISLWTYPGPCPRCGKPIKRQKATVMWD